MGYAFLPLCVLHLLTSLSVFSLRPIWMYVCGIAMVVLVILQLILYRMHKKGHKALAYGIFGICVLHTIVGLVSFQSYKQKISQIQIQEIDLHDVIDGEYYGKCDIMGVILLGGIQ